MIEKLAVLVVENGDGSVIITHGNKGEIYQEARALIHSLNDNPEHGVARVTALGHAGVLKERTWKANIPAPLTITQESSEDVESDEDTEPESDVGDLRKALKAKGVRVPPRINDDTLRALAVEHGVEA